jgi:hypothetical protein
MSLLYYYSQGTRHTCSERLAFTLVLRTIALSICADCRPEGRQQGGKGVGKDPKRTQRRIRRQSIVAIHDDCVTRFVSHVREGPVRAQAQQVTAAAAIGGSDGGDAAVAGKRPVVGRRHRQAGAAARPSRLSTAHGGRAVTAAVRIESKSVGGPATARAAAGQRAAVR